MQTKPKDTLKLSQLNILEASEVYGDQRYKEGMFDGLRVAELAIVLLITIKSDKAKKAIQTLSKAIKEHKKFPGIKKRMKYQTELRMKIGAPVIPAKSESIEIEPDKKTHEEPSGNADYAVVTREN